MSDLWNNLDLLSPSQLLQIIDADPNFAGAGGVGETPAGQSARPGLQGVTKQEADAIFDLYENQGGANLTFGVQIGPNGALPPQLSQQAQQDLTTILNDPGLAAILAGGTGNAITGTSLASVFWEVAHSALDATRLGDISGFSSATEQQNGALLDALTDLAANFDTYNQIAPNFMAGGALPANAPPQLAVDLQALTTPGILVGLEDSSGNITQSSVQTFADKVETDLDNATISFDAYKSANPTADPAALEMARQAADLAAYATVISEGTGGTGNGQITQLALKSIVDDPFGFPPNIVDAARLFSSTTLFDAIASTGEDPARPAPTTFDADAISSWLAQGAPVTQSDVQTLLTQDAIANATAAVDTSQLGADLFANPQHYSGAQKAAVLLQLQQQLQKIMTIDQEFPTTGYYVGSNMAGPIAVITDLQNHISQLRNDADVKSFEASAVPAALKAVVSGNGGLSAIFQNQANTFNDRGSAPAASATLGNAIAAAGGDIAAGVANFVAEANFLNAALPPGQPGGGAGPAIDIKTVAANSPDYANVLSYFRTNIATGVDFQSDLKQAQANSDTDPLAAASASFMGEVAGFTAVLTSQDVSACMPQVMQSFNDIVLDNALNGANPTQLNDILSWMAPGSTAGEPDDATVTTIITQAEAQNPSAFVDPSGVKIPPASIMTAIKQVVDDIRGGAKVSDALDKLKVPNLGNTGIQNLYGLGMFHAVSAFMGGLALTSKATTVQGQATPEQIASMVASGMSMVGSLGEASTKYASKTAGFNIADFSKSQLKIIENSSKIFGSAGSAISGVLSLLSGIDQLNSGDTVDGALNVTSGTVSLVSAGASATDGSLGLASELGFTEALGMTSDGLAALSAGVAALAGALGIGGALLGIAGLIIGNVLSYLKQQKLAENDSGAVNIVLNQYGITGQGILTPPPPGPGDGPPGNAGPVGRPLPGRD